MKSRFKLIILLCLACFFSLQSQDKFAQDLALIELQYPWIDAGNAAGLLTLDSLNLSEVELSALWGNGEYGSVFSGQKSRDFNVRTKSYRYLKHSVVYGQFEYLNGTEQDLRFNNTIDPSITYPYQLIDTLGTTDYLREGLRLEAGFASPLSSTWHWGTMVKYKIGTAYQTKDPRALNRFQDISLRPGIKLNLLKHQFGLDMNYAYYNEDVDLSIVQEGRVHTFFQLHGLGQSNYHRANTYARRYDKDTWGTGVQWSTKGKEQTFLTGIHAQMSLLKVRDGRAGGDARWSTVKDDASLQGRTFKMYHSAKLFGPQYFQRIQLTMEHQMKLGSEPVQRLEKSDVNDIMQWKTYSVEDKYYARDFQTTITYDYVRLYENQSLKSHFIFESHYLGVEEEYYIPDSYLRYQHLTLSTSYLKRWLLSKAALAVEGHAGIRFHMGSSYYMDESNAIVQQVNLPNFIYLSNQYSLVGVGTNYEHAIKKRAIRLVVKTSVDYYRAEGLGTHLWWNSSLGMLF